MSYTKRQFIIAAFEELGLSDANYNLQDGQLKVALKRLDGMMATWDAKGLRLSYPIPSSPEDSNLDTETTVPDKANEAIYLNLAIKIASSFGKVVSQELKVNAREAYRTLLASNAYPLSEKQLDNLPRGAGAKVRQGYNSTYITPEDPYIEVGSDGDLDLGL